MDSGVLKLATFAVISASLLRISWRSLRAVGSHGFYRFFAWEAIVALILINSAAWFTDPWSLRQIVSWCLLLVSLVMAALGYHLIVAGKPTSERLDPTLMSFEKTSVLVTTGIYRHIRHPMYGSLLFLAWGVFLKGITWYSVCLIVIATAGLVATAKADEVECARYFGPSYEEYMKRTRMFAPWLV
jgi:protein-S-isoprenylcysteine O-methyltransferase Ste14